jgi:hypothetical protein
MQRKRKGGSLKDAGGESGRPEPTVIGAVRRERLVDQYARLIWSITVDFKLVESDAADVAQNLAAAARAH